MKIEKVNLPDISYSFDEYPAIKKDETLARHRDIQKKLKERDLTHIIIYGDREHHANISYFSGGYDSRFEESLIIIQKNDLPIFIVGNEGYTYSDISTLKHKKILFQTFSLQGMTRDKKILLREILKECGFNQSSKVGIIGLKYYEAGEVENPVHSYDIPHYIIEELLKLTPSDNIANVTDIINHPVNGIRCTLTPHEIARFEIMNNYLSNQMKKIINSLEIGISESEALSCFDYVGIPFIVHPNVNFGTDRVLLGLASPSFNIRLKKGDPVNIGLGIEGASIARTGCAVYSEKDFTGAAKNIISDFYFPYFRALQTWYELLDYGISSKAIFNSIMRKIGGNNFGVTLNPGHQIHIEEWINSPFREDKDFTLKSGMAFQCDLIAFPGEPYVGVHVEDTVILANEELQDELKATYPQVFKRIGIRRDMMKDILGISINDHILPLSNIQSVLNPFLLDPSYVMTSK